MPASSRKAVLAVMNSEGWSEQCPKEHAVHDVFLYVPEALGCLRPSRFSDPGFFGSLKPRDWATLG